MYTRIHHIHQSNCWVGLNTPTPYWSAFHQSMEFKNPPLLENLPPPPPSLYGHFPLENGKKPPTAGFASSPPSLSNLPHERLIHQGWITLLALRQALQKRHQEFQYASLLWNPQAWRHTPLPTRKNTSSWKICGLLYGTSGTSEQEHILGKSWQL